jgi:hypothetical protein
MKNVEVCSLMLLKRRVAPLLACMLALAGCQLGFTSAPNTPLVTPAPTVVAPHRGPVLVQYCDDDTGSYPRSDFAAANRLVANSLIQSVAPNSEGLVLYATSITSDTFNPANTLAPFIIPRIDNYPTLPTPLPTPRQDNPISYPATATAAADQNNTAYATYNAAIDAVNNQLAFARGQITQDVKRLTSWNPPVDFRATSVWGCLQLARDRFHGQPGTKYLIIASDMENNTNVDFTSDFASSHALSGVNVHVIFYVCQSASTCGQKTATWQHVFKVSGAQSIRFDDPAQSQALTNLFGGM